MSQKSKYFDDDTDCWWGGMYGTSSWYDDPNYLARPHDKLLIQALWQYWSKNDALGYQYLGDCYNEFIRKPSEAPLAPPPTHL